MMSMRRLSSGVCSPALLFIASAFFAHAQSSPATTNVDRLEVKALAPRDPRNVLFVPTVTTDCTTLRFQRAGAQCFDTDTDADGDGTVGTLYICASVTGASSTCASWHAMTGVVVPDPAQAVMTSDGNGALVADTAFSWEGTSNYLYSVSTDLDGDGTAASADWNGDGTTDEVGLRQNAAMRVDTLFGPSISGSIDLDAGSATAWTPTVSNISAFAMAWQHAALYGVPEEYLLPSVYNAWSDIAMGTPLIADCNADGSPAGLTGGDCANGNTTALISQCWGNNCTTDVGGACITTTDATANGIADTDNDGTADFAVGDVVSFGFSTNTTNAGRVYVISAIAAGTGSGTDCPVSTDNRITLALSVNQNGISGPDADANGSVDSNMALARVWRNSTHLTNTGYYLMGLRLGYAPRSRDGHHGPNLLANGEADAETSLPYFNWTYGPPNSAGTPSMSTNDWSATAPSAGPNYNCVEGNTRACLYLLGGTTGDYLESMQKIAVTPGETLILSGNAVLASGGTQTFAALVDDRDHDGTWGEDTDMRWTPSSTDILNTGFQFRHQPFWASFAIPEGVHEVRVRIAKSSSGTTAPSIDGLTLKRASTWFADTFVEDVRSGRSFLINDFGTRQVGVLITGDSWATNVHLEAGLESALATRFGRSVASQVVLGGAGGYGSLEILNNFYDRIGKYQPLYTVVIMGTNDICGSQDSESCLGASTATATFGARMDELAHRIMAMGSIPIFVTPLPIGDNGTAFMTTSRELKDIELRLLKNKGSVPLFSGPSELCGQGSIDFGAVAANTSGSASDTTEFGLSANMACRCSPTADFSAADDDLLFKFCRVSAANTLTLHAYCANGGGCADPSAMTVDYCCTRK